MPRAVQLKLQFLIIIILFQWSCGDIGDISNRSKKSFVHKYLETLNITNGINITMKRNTSVGTKGSEGLKCLSCLAYTSDTLYNYCMNAIRTNFEYCITGQQCFTEFHPFYVKRGCIGYGKINKKFYCNCPLCNNKPSNDIDFYEYESIKDWTFDNKRLQRQAKNGDKLCKTCHTGKDAINDSLCLDGKYVDSVACRSDQVCFTNINDITGLVTRGCVNAPVFNSIRFNCNHTDCNNRNLIYYIESQNKLLPIMYTDEIRSKPRDREVGSKKGRIKERGKAWKRGKWGQGVRKHIRLKQVNNENPISSSGFNNSWEKIVSGMKCALESIVIVLWILYY